MSAGRPQELRRASIRVALAATGLVAVAYLLVALAVVAIVTQDLTSQIDQRLAESLSHVPGQQFPGGGQFEPPPGGWPFGPVLLSWTVKADRTVIASGTTPALPAAYILVAGLIDVLLLIYKPGYAWPGLIIVLLGVPVYFVWSRRAV